MTKKRAKEPIIERYAAAGLAIFVIIAWQVAVPLLGLSEFVLPTPWIVGERLIKDFWLLLAHSSYTLFEVGAGFGLAAVVGIPLAFAIFYSRPFERAIYPLLVALQTIPKIALAPLLVLYLGYGWGPKITLAFLISVFPIIISTASGVRNVDRHFIDVARAFGGKRRQIVAKVLMPAALPFLLTGIRLAIGRAIVGVVVGELFGANAGLGYLIIYGQNIFNMSLVMTSLMILTVIAGLMYYAVSMAERVFVPWQRN